MKAEAPGILVWLAIGWCRYLAEGLSPPESVVRATKEYREGEDIYQRFLDHNCEIGEGFNVQASQFWWGFKTWAADEELGKVNQRAFANAMISRFERTKLANGRYYMGVRMVNPPAVDI